MFRFRWLCLILITCIGGFLEAGVRFDLPEEVPDQQITGIDVIVKIPGTNYVLKFPKDGSQPTTKDAVKNACANVECQETSKVTRFYLQLFGLVVINSNGEYIKLGFDEERKLSTRIIELDDSFGNTCEQETNNRAMFYRAFRKLASTSVGRTLLYRLLIEIRRNKNGQGCLSKDIRDNKGTQYSDLQQVLKDRDMCRNVKIEASSEGGTFDSVQGKITFRLRTNSVTIISLSEQKTYVIGTEPMQSDISLFHEMNHWYHFLRHTVRYTRETGGVTPQQRNQRHPILTTFSKYHLENWAQKGSVVEIEALKKVRERNDDEKQIMWSIIEEMRNVLGRGRNDEQFLNGDDLSENAYRLCRCQSLRFGHTNRILNDVEINTEELYNEVCRLCRIEGYAVCG